MGYAEVIFEPGDKSVLQYDDEEELNSFLSTHHGRAVSGEDGGPAGGPAARVTKVVKYDTHPGDYNLDGSVDAETVKSLIDGMTKDGRVNGHQLVMAIRDEQSAVYPVDQGKHESQYKMEGVEHDLSFLSGSESGGSDV